MNRPIAVVSSLTERKEPRRMAWRVMMPKKISAMFSQEQLVGVKCKVIRWFSGLASRLPAEIVAGRPWESDQDG